MARTIDLVALGFLIATVVALELSQESGECLKKWE